MCLYDFVPHCVSTEGEIKVCTWLREISSCSCLTVLPGPAWVLLSKTNKPLFPPLYTKSRSGVSVCAKPIFLCYFSTRMHKMACSEIRILVLVQLRAERQADHTDRQRNFIGNFSEPWQHFFVQPSICGLRII